MVIAKSVSCFRSSVPCPLSAGPVRLTGPGRLPGQGRLTADGGLGTENRFLLKYLSPVPQARTRLFLCILGLGQA